MWRLYSVNVRVGGSLSKFSLYSGQLGKLSGETNVFKGKTAIGLKMKNVKI